MTASGIFVDQPIGKTGILYDYDMLSMHNSVVGVTVLKHIVQTTMSGLQHTTPALITNVILYQPTLD